MVDVMRRARPSGGNRRGAAAVEFALVLPLMMLIVCCMIDLSRVFYSQNQVIAAVREGARRASVLADPLASQAAVRAAVKSYGAPFGSPPIADNQITVAVDSAAGNVTVGVTNYQFAFVTPLAKIMGTSTVQLSRQATFRWEYAP